MRWKISLILLSTAITSTTVSVIADNVAGGMAGFTWAMIIALFGSAWAASVEWEENEIKLMTHKHPERKEQVKHVTVEPSKSNDATFLLDWDEWKTFTTTHFIDGISPHVDALFNTLEKIKQEDEYLEIDEQLFFQSVLVLESYKICLSFSHFKPEEQKRKAEEMVSILQEIDSRAKELLHKVNERKNREFEKQTRILRNKLRGD